MSEINNEKKINWLGLFTIWFGGMVSVPSLLIGSMLIKGLTFYNTLLAGFIGFSVVCIFMCLESIAAFDTKKTTVQLASSSFGVNGANILVGLVVGISCIGWFGVQCNIAGSSFAEIMSIYFEDVFSPRICSFIIGLLMMLTAVLGIKYLKYLNYIAVPGKILLLAFGVIISFQGKSFNIISSYTPPEKIAFLTAIGLSIGFISVGGVISPDYARFAKSKKDVVKGTILGLLPAGISLLGVGSMLAILQNTYDIVEIFSKFGYPFMALLILIVATWTTNVMNAYSSGLALNQLFHFPENKRYISTIIAGVIGGGLAAIGILDKFMDFLMILTITVPPIAGVLISDYFVSKSFNPNTNQAFNWKGIVSWLFGVTVMLVMENPIKNVLGIAVSLISYYVFQLFFKDIKSEKIELWITHKIIQFHKYGGSDVIEIDEIKLQNPEDNEVRFKVTAFALNRADLLFINGHHYTLPVFPSRIGSEATGIVDKIGKNVTNFKIGDTVTSIPFYSSKHGVQGEYAITPEKYLTHSPSFLKNIEACSIWMQYLTPYFALIEIGKVKKGEYVLVPAASSSAGLGTIQLLKCAGAKIIATTRTKEKAAFLYNSGADNVVIMNEQSLSDSINEITNNKGVRLVFDPIGGSFLDNYTDALAKDAILFLYGLLSGEVTQVPIVQMVRNNAIIYPYSMFNFVCKPKMLERGKSFILNGINNGRLNPVIDKVFPFLDTKMAYEYMESNIQKGKIVVEVN